jgi:hypothetical protein
MLIYASGLFGPRIYVSDTNISILQIRYDKKNACWKTEEEWNVYARRTVRKNET